MATPPTNIFLVGYFFYKTKSFSIFSILAFNSSLLIKLQPINCIYGYVMASINPFLKGAKVVLTFRL